MGFAQATRFVVERFCTLWSCDHGPVTEPNTAGEINKACQRLAKARRQMLAKESLGQGSGELKRLATDIQLVEGWRGAHAVPLRNASANLRYYVKPHSATQPDIVSVTQRLKKFSTILDKQCRFPTMRLTKMEDIGGVRAILPDQDAADDVYRRLRRNWKVTRDRDYVREPKPSGYRALHLTVVKQGFRIEVQLRTYLQDVWANQVESDSRWRRIDYKSGVGQQEVHDYYIAVSELFAMSEASISPSEAFRIELQRRRALAETFLSPTIGSQQ